jgi:hypothetical protein
MAGKIFINYRREESGHVAGRLHDRLAQVFGRDQLFMDIDNIPVGVDFVTHLNNQVAACDAILVVIGPNWLKVKDRAGQRRLHQPDDFVAIEIAAALARDIRVIPVLVDGARLPRASELPDALKPLARRQAAEVRHEHFGQDAETLVARMREAKVDKALVADGREAVGDKALVADERKAIVDKARGPDRWRVLALVGLAAAALLLVIGWGGFAFFERIVEKNVQQAELKWDDERKAAEAEANRKLQQAEEQRLAEQERRARAAEEEAKRKANEAEQQRLAKAEQERQAKAEQERQAKAEQERQAKAAQDRVDARNAYNSGTGYLDKSDYDRAIADYNESIRLNPNSYLTFGHRVSHT